MRAGRSRINFRMVPGVIRVQCGGLKTFSGKKSGQAAADNKRSSERLILATLQVRGVLGSWNCSRWKIISNKPIAKAR